MIGNVKYILPIINQWVALVILRAIMLINYTGDNMAGGRPTLYDPNFHPQNCIELGKQGYFKVQMAEVWDVDTDTIDEWRKKHVEFSGAYKRACNYRAAWLLAQGREGLFGNKDSQLNALAWSMMMRYDGQNTDERTVNIPEMKDCKTFSEMSQCVVRAFSEGRLTPKEANTLTDIISKGAKIEEVTELRRMLEEIETARKQGR